MQSFKAASLTPPAFEVLIRKGTEPPSTGEYNLLDVPGTYLCRLCGIALFRSTDKFISSCGWPSFDDEIEGRIKRLPDIDGRRTEIVCARCEGHLGHVFHGEHLTQKNVRHCVNSLSVDFVENLEVLDTQEALFAAGCFWGVQTLLEENSGVVTSEVGYCGGEVAYPSYEQVCRGDTGHLEAIRVVFDPSLITYEQLVHDFFCIHNPVQRNGQGPDIGPQYQSAIFYFDEAQKEIAKKTMSILKAKGVDVATELKAVSTFWPAEAYHQHYYKKNGQRPYCHIREDRFKA